MDLSLKDKEKYAEIGKKIETIEKLLFDKGYIKRLELEEYSKAHPLSGIIPTNTSMSQLISENSILCDILVKLLLEKKLFTMEKYSNTVKNINKSSGSEIDRGKVLETKLKIENLYGVLREKGYYSISEMKNAIKFVVND